MSFFSSSVKNSDPEIAKAIDGEINRQKYQIELIASENIVSKAVLEAQGSIFTNKYAEGYPGKRYYGGCEFSDDVEKLAIDRICKLFGSKFANVQAHSGASAILSVYLACLQPGDTILGMSLAAGGHLTHGAMKTISGMWLNSVQYGIRLDDGLIDYDQAEKLALEHKPKIIIAGISSGAIFPRPTSSSVPAIIRTMFHRNPSPEISMFSTPSPADSTLQLSILLRVDSLP